MKKKNRLSEPQMRGLRLLAEVLRRRCAPKSEYDNDLRVYLSNRTNDDMSKPWHLTITSAIANRLEKAGLATVTLRHMYENHYQQECEITKAGDEYMGREWWQ